MQQHGRRGAPAWNSALHAFGGDQHGGSVGVYCSQHLLRRMAWAHWVGVCFQLLVFVFYYMDLQFCI
jgi:hypothetical protein